ncbi:MFS general substrate transporter [Mycena rebaudengoi]|nr:MFS general substrate transporter [Mycena rebaudengoi]
MATERTPLVPRAPDEWSRLDFGLLMTGIWSLTFTASLDATIVATLISTIGSSLQSMQLSSWVGTSYLLALCAFTPLYGRLANILGRRTSILIACSLFGVGTILCGLANNMTQLIVFRFIAGSGGGGITVVSSVIVSDCIPLKSRGLFQGFANLVFALGGAIGAPLGGYFGDTIGWRAAFLYQSPFLIFAIFILSIKIREPQFVLAAARTSITAKLKRIDYAGSATLITTLGTFLVGTNFKSTYGYGWGDVQVWGFLAASGVLAVLFILIELKLAAEPAMPVSMLKRGTPGFVALNNFLLASLAFSTVYNTPLYFTAARLRSSTNTGAHLITNSLGVAIGSLSAGWYMRKTGHYWTLQAFAGLCIITANFTLASWDENTPEWVLYVTLMPSGYGFATMLTTTLIALIASVPREDIPIATGISYLFRTSGQVLGVALSATLTQTLLAHHLRARITGDDAPEIISKILASTAYIRTLPADLQQHATTSWALALRAVFYCQSVMAVCLFLSVLPIEEHPLPETVVAPAKPAVQPDAETAGDE